MAAVAVEVVAAAAVVGGDRRAGAFECCNIWLQLAGSQ